MLPVRKILIIATCVCWTSACRTPPKPVPNLTRLESAPTPRPVELPHPQETIPIQPSLAATNGLSDDWISWERWSAAKGLGATRNLNAPERRVFESRWLGGQAILVIGSRLAYWNGLELWLGFSPQLIDGRPFVHILDAQKNFEPLLDQDARAIQARGTIVIDPGHGGTNSGAKSVLGNDYEKVFTLDWAERLRRLLAAKGWKVFLTRTNDCDLALAERVAMADRFRADFFLSLHFNSAPAGEQHAGLETYCLTPAGMPSNLTRGFADDLHHLYPNNGFDAQNLQCAMRVQRSLLQATGRIDQGVRHARFMGVLRGQHRPAILVEGGYLSNPQEAGLIATPAYRELLAHAVARAFIDGSLISQPGIASDPKSASNTASSEVLPSSPDSATHAAPDLPGRRADHD